MIEPKKFRKRPVEIEAIQWTGMNSLPDIMNWITRGKYSALYHYETNSIAINTLEGVMIASPGDWIIKEIEGECYPCKPSIFIESYEEIE